jgi:predicted Holliday junction resolvase-like endonuclease
MNNQWLPMIDGLQEILGICPCCRDIFRLAEAQFIFPQRHPQSCEYLELIALERESASRQERIDAAEQRFNENHAAQEEPLREEARRLVKQCLKKIDPTFTGRGIDPQDVKVIFHPVEFIVFDGLRSLGGLKRVLFMSRLPQSRSEEVLVKSMDVVIAKGYVEFESLHLIDDGSFTVRK